MPKAPCKFVKRWSEFVPKSKMRFVPRNARGIYVLLKYRARHKPNEKNYDIIYVGMAGSEKGSVKGRLKRHTESMSKNREWSHFSIFEVHDNTTEEEIRELEALFRIIFRKDSHANKLNIQKGSRKLNRVRIKRIEKWAP